MIDTGCDRFAEAIGHVRICQRSKHQVGEHLRVERRGGEAPVRGRALDGRVRKCIAAANLRAIDKHTLVGIRLTVADEMRHLEVFRRGGFVNPPDGLCHRRALSIGEDEAGGRRSPCRVVVHHDLSQWFGRIPIDDQESTPPGLWHLIACSRFRQCDRVCRPRFVGLRVDVVREVRHADQPLPGRLTACVVLARQQPANVDAHHHHGVRRVPPAAGTETRCGRWGQRLRSLSHNLHVIEVYQLPSEPHVGELRRIRDDRLPVQVGRKNFSVVEIAG